ncbi:MAG: hypothetical protein KIT31_33100, partial [Deltaproteobacteria bacterium]|nr:hypothetical protein [Deltaproteobacteria bacterium]
AYDPDASLDEVRAAVARTFGRPPRAAVREVRARLVGAHRGAYAAYRAEVFCRIERLCNRGEGSAAYIWLHDAGAVRHDASPSGLQRLLQWCMGKLAATWLFLPWLYLALALALLPMARRDGAIAALLASGIAGELALAVAGHDANFRHAIWLVAATALGALLLVAARIPSRDRSRVRSTVRSSDETTA